MAVIQKELNNLQRQYDGFIKTPPLWNGDTVYSLNQFPLILGKCHRFNKPTDKNKRLGHLAEAFLRFQLQRQENIKILENNVQIQTRYRRTVGELDFLLKYKNQFCHLENVYKFYLYDTKKNGNELDKLIGPNKRDWLMKKLEKLKRHQLPLIFRKECEYLFKKYHVEPIDVKQFVCFKAQLFLPFGMSENKFAVINKECIKGFYLKINELERYKTAKFFLPDKHHWFSEPHMGVKWLTLEKTLPKITAFLVDSYSPMCWIKKQNGELSKCFVVWW